MRLRTYFYGTLVMMLAACANPAPPAGPMVVTQPTASPASVSAGPGGIDANGRATGPLDVNGFLARVSPGHPNCLILQRPSASLPYTLQSPGAFIGLGGQCPSLYWRATIGTLEEFGQGIINIQGIGRCQIPGGTTPRGGSGSCDRV